MDQNRYLFVFLIFSFFILSCQKITEPIVDINNYIIVYTANDNGHYDLYKIDLYNLKPIQITFNGKSTSAQRSPDGKYLYFLSTGIGGLDVFKYDILTDKIQNITNSSGQENSFDVTPNDQKIVMGMSLKSDSSFISQIFIKNIASDKIKRLTNDNIDNYKPIFFIN